jgi:hypothetical protein
VKILVGLLGQRPQTNDLVDIVQADHDGVVINGWSAHLVHPLRHPLHIARRHQIPHFNRLM